MLTPTALDGPRPSITTYQLPREYSYWDNPSPQEISQSGGSEEISQSGGSELPNYGLSNCSSQLVGADNLLESFREHNALDTAEQQPFGHNNLSNMIFCRFSNDYFSGEQYETMINLGILTDQEESRFGNEAIQMSTTSFSPIDFIGDTTPWDRVLCPKLNDPLEYLWSPLGSSYIEDISIFYPITCPSEYPSPMQTPGLLPATVLVGETDSLPSDSLQKTVIKSLSTFPEHYKREIEPISLNKTPVQKRTNRQYLCEECGASFEHDKDRKRHKKSVHGSSHKWYCPKSGCKRYQRGFTRKDKFFQHWRTHASDVDNATLESLAQTCYRPGEIEPNFSTFKHICKDAGRNTDHQCGALLDVPESKGITSQSSEARLDPKNSGHVMECVADFGVEDFINEQNKLLECGFSSPPSDFVCEYKRLRNEQRVSLLQDTSKGRKGTALTWVEKDKIMKKRRNNKRNASRKHKGTDDEKLDEEWATLSQVSKEPPFIITIPELIAQPQLAKSSMLLPTPNRFQPLALD